METDMTPTTQEKPSFSKLSDLQISLLRIFEQKLDQEQTLEVRKLLMDYFDRKLQVELEEVSVQKGYTETDYRRMLRDDAYAAE